MLAMVLQQTLVNHCLLLLSCPESCIHCLSALFCFHGEKSQRPGLHQISIFWRDGWGMRFSSGGQEKGFNRKISWGNTSTRKPFQSMASLCPDFLVCSPRSSSVVHRALESSHFTTEEPFLTATNEYFSCLKFFLKAYLIIKKSWYVFKLFILQIKLIHPP